MQNEQEFYRCLVSDAAGRTLKKILEIIRDDTLSDEICFHKIEAIISLYEELGISTGSQFPPQGRGAHSFLEKNPPHTPGRKAPGRFDFALDPQRHKGRGPRPPPLETNPQRPGQQPESTVTATRFPTLMGRQSCHFLGSTSLYPPPAALWCFHLWNPLPETRDGAGKTNSQGDEGR